MQKWGNVLAVAVTCLLIILIYIYYQKILHSKKANELLSEKVKERAYELNASHRILQTRLYKRNLVLKRHTSDFRRSFTVVNKECSFIQNDEREYFQQIKEAIVVLDSVLDVLYKKV